MKAFNRYTGKLGEDMALKVLLDKGFVLMERNFSTKFGEIDLIMKDGEVWVFVEVKTKRGLGFGSPEDMINKGKIRRVKNMAVMYLKGKEVKCRVDVVAIVLDEEEKIERVRYYANVE